MRGSAIQYRLPHSVRSAYRRSRKPNRPPQREQLAGEDRARVQLDRHRGAGAINGGPLRQLSRVFAFGGGGEPEVWIGSADMMHRNLDRRVEALVRVKDPAQQAELHALIDLAMDEGTGSWWLDGDGTWTRHHLDSAGNPLRDLQQQLIANRRTRPADG